MNDVVIYIIAISFQLSGALLLVFYSISTKRKNVIKRFAGKCLIYRDNNTNEITYDKDALKIAFRDAWLNKIAFALIALGYFFGVFGEIDEKNKNLIALVIGLLTVMIMILSYFIVTCIIKYSSNINKELSNGELSELGIEPDIESLSNKEIDDIINETC